MINLKINDIPVAVPQGATVLDAARKLNIKIPTLCHHEDLCVAGNCRVCVVEMKGARTLQASCALPVADGMEIFTNTNQVRQARSHIIELLLAEHRTDCLKCPKNGNCELQDLALAYRVEERVFSDISIDKYVDRSSPSIQKDDSKCIRCQRCVRTCTELQAVSALTVAHKGKNMKIETFWNKPLHYVVCTNCGQCVLHCPTGALTERNYIEEVWQAIGDPKKHVVVQTAPAVRVSLGETLGYDPGKRVTKTMVTALRRIGFDKVFDTDFTADLTIIEEGHELLHRLTQALRDKEEVSLPMITSCSPGWIKYLEHEFSGLLPHLSSCKSPQQMFGAVAKTYYAQKAGVNPEDIVVVSIMPCTAKKFEAVRPEMNSSGYRDVDYVLTTRELGLMIKQAGLDLRILPDSEYDSLLGASTGAAVIFGATGGVMEAALRTAYEVITGQEVPFENLNITPVRGLEGIKEASIVINKPKPEYSFLQGVELKVAIANGLSKARVLMKQLDKGESPYHFIEIMACPGGCLGGGGQPIPTNAEVRKKRAQAIYSEDMEMTIRKSHENPEIIKIYEDFLIEPLGKMSHKLLHTHYVARHR
ncbi:MAG TPA: 2Fe-2S iron-sulfur cluster binding domain-containing protein [Candidatus Marinimicrobia bacterium]|nr:2Fe-2S iron-sulfur cluster binding domain-containing protein [Candidatus Neomarinimicrobiota bacterium]